MSTKPAEHAVRASIVKHLRARAAEFGVTGDHEAARTATLLAEEVAHARDLSDAPFAKQSQVTNAVKLAAAKPPAVVAVKRATTAKTAAVVVHLRNDPPNRVLGESAGFSRGAKK